jgi:hypothetical protein
MLSALAPSAVLYPALAAMGQDGPARACEEMQQVLAVLKARHGGLLQEAGLLVQHLKEVACLWSEQWMHILRDIQVPFLHEPSDYQHEDESAARSFCLSRALASSITRDENHDCRMAKWGSLFMV